MNYHYVYLHLTHERAVEYIHVNSFITSMQIWFPIWYLEFGLLILSYNLLEFKV